ncbi:MAG: helix-turn-helix transcriptional regulator [Parvibaculum sp.]
MAVRQARSRRVRKAEIDLVALQSSVEALRRAGGFAAGEAALGAICGLVGMLRAIWTPDVASPLFEPHADAFLKRQGWPDETVAAMWQGGVALRMPLNIRCRFEHTPFAISLYDDHRKRRAPYSGEQKRVADMMQAEGFNTVLVVPVHLPRAQVAMLGWAGPQTLDEAEALLAEAAPLLLAAGHYFMALFARVTKREPVPESARSALTPREWDCLQLVARGHREAEVAEMNGIAPTTVRYHLDNVAAKFGARNRSHAAAIAAQLGLVGKLSG